MGKKHEIRFKTATGEFFVATDDINDVLSQGAIMDLLGITQRQPVRYAHSDDDAMTREYTKAQRELQVLRAEIERVKQSAVTEDVTPVQQPLQPQQPVQKPVQQPQQQAQTKEPVQPAPQQEAVLPSTFLDILPPQMKETLWAGLTSDQQQEWLRKYNITR